MGPELHQSFGWDHACEALHDLVRLVLLVVGEDPGDEVHEDQSDANHHVVFVDTTFFGVVDDDSNEAEDGAGPEQGREAAEHDLEELDPLRGPLGRGEGVGAVPLQPGLGRLRGEAGVEVCLELLGEVVQGHGVLVRVGGALLHAGAAFFRSAHLERCRSSAAQDCSGAQLVFD